MHFYIILLILCFGIYNVQCNVDLKKGRSERVSFDGDELTIAVDNSLGASDDLKICFGSTPEASFPPCPTGFVRKTIEIPASSNRQFSLTRHGQLLKDGLPVEMLGKVEFNEDGTLNITVAELPDVKTAVSLPNAKIYVPEKPEEEQKVKKESNGATIGIIVGVVALLVFVIACISAIGVCLYRRKKNKNQPIMPPEIVVQSLPKAADAPDPVPEINSKEKPPSPQAAPELVSKSPKMPVQSRPTANVVPALETKPITPAVQNPTPQGEVSLPQAPSMSTEPVLKPPKKVKEADSKGKARTPTANPSAESTEQTKDAILAQQVKQESDPKKSLKVEKTQTATVPSPPTPKFSEHPRARRAAEKSKFKEKPGIPYSETPNPFTKKNYKKADELGRFELLTESIRCYGMRNGKFNRHDNFVLRERFFTRPHRVHVWEKNIFKSTPSKAVDAANLLVDRIERELKVFGYRPEDDLTQNPILWGHLDYEEAKMSKLYWFLIQQRPDLFDVKDQDVRSAEVRAMPIAMLYALILNTKLTRKFREELVVELRAATVDVIRLAGKDQLRLAAFPLNYLVLLYTKDPANYVEGRSVHSVGRYIRY